MNHLSLLLHLIFFIMLCVSATANDEDQFAYSGFTGINLTLDGAAIVTPNGLLELTNGILRLKGHAFHPTPFRFSRSPNGTMKSFVVSYVFAIYSRTSQPHCMGLINDNNNGNPSNHFFAVELDTNQNELFHDINNNHVGIDINGVTSVKSNTAGYYDNIDPNTFHNATLMSYKVMQVWLEYNGDRRQINVTLAPIHMAKPSKPLLSINYNLSTVLTDMAYIGFSSFFSRHYVLGWSFAMNKPIPAIDISKLPKLPRDGPKPRSKVLEIVLPLATAAFVLAVGITAILLIRRTLRYFGPHRFSYKDLFHVTEGFKNKNLLGIGGFGRVYRGLLSASKLEIAVKKFSHESKKGMREFNLLRSLVQLHGYCRRKGELLLVYEYMSKGSPGMCLYDLEDKPTLSWAQRFRIIKGIASALLYLHEEWERVVLHSDIKPSNVLLDDEMNGKLGDFGLARLYDHGTDPQTTHFVGTIGYLAPELARTRKATPLTDVFSFGIFVLEVIVVDTKLQGDYDVDEASLTLKLVVLSPFHHYKTQHEAGYKYLNRDMAPPDLNPMHLSFHILSLMQNKGFDPENIANQMTMASSSAVSDLSGGR
ncbi:hypothetical protein PVAP13_7NG131617 [Panicum virgatum]|uniref:Protein kinase domain-containing protein n=1 Tax=Panicum virgatum TaxID=38727 RepID=A0A8T0PX46_PANVG|nr:hypothetical protein PVAP13_7NG131617 [Panicum virgatum]